MPPDRGDAARQPGGAVDGGSLRRVPAIPQAVPPDKFESQAAGAGG
jgi:hypothetical protein